MKRPFRMHFQQFLHAGAAHHAEGNPIHYFYLHTSRFLMPQKYNLSLANGLQKFRNPSICPSCGICLAKEIHGLRVHTCGLRFSVCGLRPAFVSHRWHRFHGFFGFADCGLRPFCVTQNRWSSESRGQIYLDYAESRQRKTKSNHGNHRNTVHAVFSPVSVTTCQILQFFGL